MTSLEGTQEAKRRYRAMPGAVSSNVAAGCIYVVAAFAALCVIAYRRTGWTGWLILAAPGLLVVAVALTRAVYGWALLLAARATLGRRGVRCLVIHSDSPAWQAHIASGWLPRLGPAAATLNWSTRATWGSSLEVRLFRHFCEGNSNFNPAVIVFRGLRRPLVFRFFYAFQETRKGRGHYLAELERQMFQALGV